MGMSAIFIVPIIVLILSLQVYYLFRRLRPRWMIVFISIISGLVWPVAGIIILYKFLERYDVNQ